MKDNQKLDEQELCSIVSEEKNRNGYRYRQVESKSKLYRDLSSILSRFFKKLKDFDTDTCVPYHIFNISHSADEHELEYVGVRYETEGVALTEARKRFQQAEAQFKDELAAATLEKNSRTFSENGNREISPIAAEAACRLKYE